MSSARLFCGPVRSAICGLCLAIALCLISARPASAQYFGVFDAFSPLAWFPALEGEVTARLTWVDIASGNLSAPNNNGGSLRDTFHLTQGGWFLDSMVRVQLSRLSVRAVYELRDFAAHTRSVLGPFGNTTLPGSARISYSGLRLGGDLDIIQWNRTRLGIDVDYDVFSPTFTFPSLPVPSEINQVAMHFSGPNATTLGFHAVYNPLWTCFGGSPIIKARARWPISGSQVTDWEISGGIASPNTVLGSFSLTTGYRSTTLSFHNIAVGTFHIVGTNLATATTVVTTPARFDGTFQGWFAEFAWYY